MPTHQPLPKAVQRQLEQAEALEAQLTAPPAPPAPAEPTPAPAPAPAVTAPQAPQSTAPQPPSDPASVWEQRYRTAQGMLNSQVSALHAQLREQGEQFKAALETLQTELARAKEAPSGGNAEGPKIDPRDVEQFGEDMMGMVQRYVTAALAAAEAKTGHAVGALGQRLTQLESAVGVVSRKTEVTAEATFWTTLRRLVPDFEAINADPDFLGWLAETDRLTRLRRQVVLDKAQKDLDAEAVAEVFTLFKESRPKPAASELAAQVSPSAGGAAQAPIAPPAAEVVTSKYINDFYADVARGRYRGREAEQQRIADLIDRAVGEGRVV